MRTAGIVLGFAAISFCAAAVLAETSSHQPPVRSPHVNYALHCQGCHLPDGRGMAGKVPDMRGQLARFLAVPGGRDYIARVPGVATARLGDSELAALVNWLIVEMGPEPVPDFPRYTAEEMASLRGRWLNRPADVRTDLMKAIGQLPQAAY